MPPPSQSGIQTCLSTLPSIWMPLAFPSLPLFWLGPSSKAHKGLPDRPPAVCVLAVLLPASCP